MIKHRPDSIKELNDKQAAEAEKDKTIAEQADTIELLKGCIMELADVVYGDGEAPRRKGRANDRPGPRVAIIKNCRKGGA